MLSRSAMWNYRADTRGDKTFTVRVWSGNGGEVFATKTIKVRRAVSNLVETAVMANAPPVIRAPGSAFSVSDTVRNVGVAASETSTTRYYLSLDAMKSADDRLLSGTRSVPALGPGASHSGTVNVTIPNATPLTAYFLLACADDRGWVEESDEANNCLVAEGRVFVTRPDLAAIAVSSSLATIARGAKLPVTDTTYNFGGVAAASSRTKYYLSLDHDWSADDRLLGTDRQVPPLAGGGWNYGIVTVTIPTSTPPNTYFLLACADGRDAVLETNETNNCVSSGTAVTVTP